jgi:hypothetical protein
MNDAGAYESSRQRNGSAAEMLSATKRYSSVRQNVLSPHCAVASFARIKLFAVHRRGVSESMISNAANRFLNFG